MSKKSLNISDYQKSKELLTLEPETLSKCTQSKTSETKKFKNHKKQQFDLICTDDQYNVEFCGISFDAIGQFDFYSPTTTKTGVEIHLDR